MTKKNTSKSMREELANELAIDSTNQKNGYIGGNVTKKLVEKGKKGVNTKTMKEEIANELGVNVGTNATPYENGKVGGAMTKKLVKRGKTSK